MTDRPKIESVTHPTSEPKLDEKALPCPFCGGKAEVHGNDSTWALLCRVICATCYANSGRYAKTCAEAVAIWNRRAPAVPEKPQEAVAWMVQDERVILGHKGQPQIVVGAGRPSFPDYYCLTPLYAHPVSPALVGDEAGKRDPNWNVNEALAKATSAPRIAEVEAARVFPIQDGPSIPWSAIARCEGQAMRNHGGQTLERLAKRCGLGVHEALCVVNSTGWHEPEGRRIQKLTKAEAIVELDQRCAALLALLGPAGGPANRAEEDIEELYALARQGISGECGDSYDALARLRLVALAASPPREEDAPEMFVGTRSALDNLSLHRPAISAVPAHGAGEAERKGLDRPMFDAIQWLMGCADEFTPSPDHRTPTAPYWWRSEFAKRAGLVYDAEVGIFLLDAALPPSHAGETE